MRRWLWARLFSVCWGLSDVFLLWSHTFGQWSLKFDSDESYDRVGMTKVEDIHANCQPKSANRTINLRWDPQQGFVEVPQHTTSTNGTY